MKWTRISKGGTGPAAGEAARSEGPEAGEKLSSRTWLWLPSVVHGPLAEPQRGTENLEWYGADDGLTVGAYTLDGPSVYSSQGAPSVAEASCIDRELEIAPTDGEVVGSLGYWPQYANLSPGQRAKYLAWLAGGRSAPLDDAGYVFLFFFGLERRALVEKADPETSIRELLRLLDNHGHLLSFFDYASRFIAYSFAKKGIRKLTEKWFHRIFIDRQDELHEDALVVALTWLYERDLPLPASLAYEVARQDVRSSNSAVVKRLPQEFRHRFERKYDEQFKDGIRLEVSEIARAIVYRPASPSLQDWQILSKLRSIDVPDVLRVTSQFTPLVRIWAECIEELRPLAREAGGETEVPTREAYEALSPERKAETDHPDKARWDRLVEKHMDKRGRVFVPVSEIAELEGLAPGPTQPLSLRQSLELAATAQQIGHHLVPHPKTILRAYDWDETVALSRILGEPAPSTEKYYLAAAFMLELGIAMAIADGVIEKIEVLHVSDIVSSQFHLSDDDRRRLSTFRSLLIKYPPKLRLLGRRVSRVLTRPELEGLGEFLAGVAASNGVIEPSERKALRSAYRSFGVPLEKLAELLRALEGGADRPEPSPEVSERGITIDREVLNRIMADTAKVTLLVASAMGELEIEEPKKRAAGGVPVESLAFGPPRDWSDEYLDDHESDEDNVTYRMELVEEDE